MINRVTINQMNDKSDVWNNAHTLWAVIVNTKKKIVEKLRDTSVMCYTSMPFIFTY